MYSSIHFDTSVSSRLKDSVFSKEKIQTARDAALESDVHFFTDSVEWNQKINVISRKDMINFYEHHVLHSLAIAKKFPFPDEYELMDLGTGGGFPGIPLAIYFPYVKFHLVDSINKKLKVANEIVTAIALTNVTTQHIRAQEISFNSIRPARRNRRYARGPGTRARSRRSRGRSRSRRSCRRSAGDSRWPRR